MAAGANGGRPQISSDAPSVSIKRISVGPIPNSIEAAARRGIAALAMSFSSVSVIPNLNALGLGPPAALSTETLLQPTVR
jgi:hypothetical protein